MADGGFALAPKAYGRFHKGQSVQVECKDDGPSTFIIGAEYVDHASKQVVTFVGAMFPRRWDDARDRYVDCPDDKAECYQQAVAQYADGKTKTIKGDDLWAFITDEFDLPAPPLNFLSYDDMLSMPDPEWLVDGLIVEETSALLFGKSNAFKSFLGIDIGCSVATGTDWHGHSVAQAAPVLYVATEGSRGVGRQRIPGWMEAHDIPHALRCNMSMYPEEIALDNDAAVTSLLQTAGIAKARRILAGGGRVADEHDPAHAFKLVVIDIFGSSMMGPETSDETARAWVRNINRIMREMKCAVLTIAHTGWADDTRARMHTHFWGSFDTRMKAEGDKDSLTTVLKLDRHKDADSTGEWGFRMDKVTLPQGQTTLVPRLCDEVETTQKRRVSGKPAVALQALSEALIEHGRTIAGPNYPTCPVVDLGDWQTMCGRHGLTDSDNPESLKKAFHRAKSALIEKGLVKQFDNQVWKANAND